MKTLQKKHTDTQKQRRVVTFRNTHLENTVCLLIKYSPLSYQTTFWIYVHMFPSALMDTFTRKTASLVAVLISDMRLIKHTNTEIKFATKKHKEGGSYLLCITTSSMKHIQLDNQQAALFHFQPVLYCNTQPVGQPEGKKLVCRSFTQ